jgi:hypothetical protein
MKKSLLSLLLVLCVLVCGAAGWGEEAPMTGVYHDVSDGVSRLRVLPEGDGYAVTLDLYRLASFEFTAAGEGDALRGTAQVDADAGEGVEFALTPAAEGGVRVEVTASQWGLLEKGTTFDFAPGAPDMDSETFAWLFGEYCTGIAGTAGSSLKLAKAAGMLLDAAIAGDAAYCDADNLAACVAEAIQTLDDERRAELQENMSDIDALIRDALNDYDAARPVFEDAGVAEPMDRVVAHPLAQADWEAFSAAFKQATADN